MSTFFSCPDWTSVMDALRYLGQALSMSKKRSCSSKQATTHNSTQQRLRSGWDNSIKPELKCCRGFTLHSSAAPVKHHRTLSTTASARPNARMCVVVQGHACHALDPKLYIPALGSQPD